MDISNEEVDPSYVEKIGKTYIDTEDKDTSWTVYQVAYHDYYDTIIAYVFKTDSTDPTPTDIDECSEMDAGELMTAKWAKWV